MPENTREFVGLKQLLTEILGEICSISDCQSIGIRIHNNGDYPYYVHEGFPEFFITKENSVCAKDEKDTPILDEGGNPLLECMCGNVLKGRFDQKQSYFTEKGSFWTNSTTQLLKGFTEKEKQIHLRNMCNYSGYESVALIPLRAGNEKLGLIQMNDPRENMFTLEDVKNYEAIADQVGSVVLNVFEARKTMNEFCELVNKLKSNKRFFEY